MAFKMLTKNNQFQIIDTVLNKKYQANRKDVLIIDYDNDGSFYNVLGVPNFDKTQKIAFADIQDENGTPFNDASTFENWYTDNLGFSTALGGSSAGALFFQELGWIKSGLIQFSPTNGKQIYTDGMTFTKYNSDGSLTTKVIPQTDGIQFEPINPITGASLGASTSVDIDNGFWYDPSNSGAAVATLSGEEIMHVLFYDFIADEFKLIAPLGANTTPQNVKGFETRTISAGFTHLSSDVVPVCAIIVSQSTTNYLNNNGSGVFNYDKLPLSKI